MTDAASLSWPRFSKNRLEVDLMENTYLTTDIYSSYILVLI